MFTCYFKKYLGLDCPGCGMQRAIDCLIHGQLLKSISFNAALIPLVITLLILIFQLCLKKIDGGKWIVVSFCFTVFIMFVQLISKFIFNNNFQ